MVRLERYRIGYDENKLTSVEEGTLNEAHGSQGVLLECLTRNQIDQAMTALKGRSQPPWKRRVGGLRQPKRAFREGESLRKQKIAGPRIGNLPIYNLTIPGHY